MEKITAIDLRIDRMPSRNEADVLCSLSMAAEGLLYALEGWQYKKKRKIVQVIITVQKN